MRKILFVDDDLDARMIVASHLRNLGYDILTVEDAEAALRVAGENQVDAVILDVNLVGTVDGPELLNDLRRLHPGAPVILYSGTEPEAPKVRRMLRMGAHQFVSKNAPLDEVIRALQGTLSAVH